MKENVKKINTSGVTGHVLIEQFDLKGNLIDRHEKYNAITATADIFGQAAYKAMFAYHNPLNPVLARSDFRDYMRYLYLVNVDYSGDNGAALESGAEPIFPTESSIVGYVDKANQTNSSDVTLGLVNMESSYCTDTKVVWVYEFQSNKAIGEFNTIVHSRSSKSYINNPVREVSQTVLVVGKPIKVDSSCYCVFENKLYITKDKVSVVETDLTTGTETTITFGNNVSLSVNPQQIKVFKTANKTLFVYYGSSKIMVVTLENANWSYKEYSHYSNKAIVAATNDYIYYYSNYKLYRSSHDLTVKEYITVPDNTYKSFYDGYAYSYNKSKRVKLPEGDWSGQTVTAENHKLGRLDDAYAGIFENDFYFKRNVKWRKSGSTSEIGGYGNYLFKIAGNSFAQHEFAIYKHPAVINKTESKTLKITYTFDFE